MGRVYDALKRAAQTNGANGKAEDEAGARRRASGENGHGVAPNGARAGQERPAAAPVAGVPAEQLFQSSRHFHAPDAAHTSAPNERTESPAGSALPGGHPSRVAGATLGAAGSARTPEFSTVEISAARVEPHLVAVTQPHSPHAERYRSLRTRVLHAGERKRMQALVVTSAGVMEGKTLTAVNLAWLLGQADGVRALLIDGDLRQPCCAEYLGLDAPVGLSEVLAGEASLEESIVRLEPAGLHLLPGGSRRDNVAEVLSGPRFSAVLKEARRLFDYVLIDAPPLGIFTDAALLLNRADGALIVARSGKTRYAALERVLESLPRERLLGVVLNDATEDVGEQDYYYRRRYSRYARHDAGAASGEAVKEEGEA